MVDPNIIAAGIGAGANLIGGFFGSRGNSSRNWYERLDAQRVLNERVLQNQIQWRVADAKAAGIHPSLAMGLGAASSPIGTPLGQPATGSIFSDALAGAGRSIATGISRAEAARMARADSALDRREKLARIANIEADTLRKNTHTHLSSPATVVRGQTPGSRVPGSINSRGIPFVEGEPGSLPIPRGMIPYQSFEEGPGPLAGIPYAVSNAFDLYDYNLGHRSHNRYVPRSRSQGEHPRIRAGIPDLYRRYLPFRLRRSDRMSRPRRRNRNFRTYGPRRGIVQRRR